MRHHARIDRLGPIHSSVTAGAVALLATVALQGCASSPGADGHPAPPDTTRQRPAPADGPGPSPKPSLNMAPPPVMGRSTPETIRIPTLGVSSELMDLGLLDDGTLEVPPGPFPAGWYTGAPTPGEFGPAIIAGHVRWEGVDGVFADLAALQPHDRVVVERTNGSKAVFDVSEVAQYPKSAFPSREIYGDIDHAGVRLITCGGYNEQTGDYEDNTVVFAELVAARPARPAA
jgi:Sortase domain